MNSLFYISTTRRKSWLRRKLITTLLLNIEKLKKGCTLFHPAVYFSWQQLIQFPKGSLGHDLGKQLRMENHIAKKSELITYMGLLVFPNYRNSLSLPFLLLGNGQKNKSLLLHCTLNQILFAEHRNEFSQAYRLGKQLNRFTSWDISYLLNEPTTVIKAMILKESVGESEAPIIW